MGPSEMLFYGGIAAMAAAVVLGLVVLVVCRIRSTQLKRKLDGEYGERKKRN